MLFRSPAENLTETLDELDELVSGAADLGPAPLAEHRAAIDRCFSGDSIEAIIEALEAEAMETEDGDWAAETLAVMAAKSPTSQKVAFRQMRRGAGLDFAAAMALEFRLSQRFCAGADRKSTRLNSSHKPISYAVFCLKNKTI